MSISSRKKSVISAVLVLILSSNPIAAQTDVAESETKKKASDEVSALTSQAVQAFTQGKTVAGNQLFRQILTIAEKNTLGGEQAFIDSLAVISFIGADPKKQLSYYEQALRIMRVGGKPEDIARLCEAIAHTKMQDDPAGAMKNLDEAEQLDPSRKEQFEQLRQAIAASVAQRTGDYSETEDLTSSQRDAAKRVHLLADQAKQEFQSGRKTKGDELLEEILRLGETNKLGGETNFTRAYPELIYLSAPTDITKRLGYLERLLRISEMSEKQTAPTLCSQIASIVMGKGQTLRMESLEEAKQRYPSCAQTFEGYRQSLAANAKMAKGDFSDMEKSMSKEQIAQMREMQALGARMAKGDYSAMLPLMKRKWEESKKNGDNDESATGLAIFSVLADDVAGARQYVLLMEKDPKNHESSDESPLPGVQDLVVSEVTQSAWGATSLGVFYHLRFAAQDDDEVKRNALQMILSTKNRDLDDASRSISRLRSGSRKGAELADRLMKEYASTSNVWAAAALNCEEISKRDEDAATERMRNLEEKFSGLEGGDPTADDGNSAPRVAEIQKELHADDALVEFAEVWFPEFHHGKKPPIDLNVGLNDIHYVAYVLRSDGKIRGFDLGSVADIDKELRFYRSVMENYNPNPDPPLTEAEERDEMRRVRDSAHRLYDLLWKPLLSVLPAEGRQTGHVYVSPDSNLALLPFDGLLADDGRYLIEGWQVSYLSSGRQLVEMRRSEEHGSGIAVFAAPQFGDGAKKRQADSRTDIASSQRGRAAGTNKTRAACLSRDHAALPRTLAEAEAIHQIFSKECPDKACLHTGEDATDAGLEAVSSPKVLHIATHGYYVDPPKRAAPVKLSEELNKKAKYRFLRSGLILGQEKGGNTDNGGIVTSLEIALLNLRATDLVVLSACDSGVGDTTPGDNVSGLRSAFHIAGAKAVISSLWSVNDEAGQELMEKFYKNLAKGKAGKMLTINQALREAKLEMIGTETPRHPYYWASFVMEGKDDVLFPQLSNN